MEVPEAAEGREDTVRGAAPRSGWDEDGEAVVREVEEVGHVPEAMPREALGPRPGHRPLEGREGVSQRSHEPKRAAVMR